MKLPINPKSIVNDLDFKSINNSKSKKIDEVYFGIAWTAIQQRQLDNTWECGHVPLNTCHVLHHGP